MKDASTMSRSRSFFNLVSGCPLGAANAMFCVPTEPYPIPDPPSTHQIRYTQSPHPAGQIERLRFVPGRLMGLGVIPRPAVAGGIAERSLERRHARMRSQ